VFADVSCFDVQALVVGKRGRQFGTLGFTAFGDDVPVKQDAHLRPANIGFQAVMAFLYGRNFARPAAILITGS